MDESTKLEIYSWIKSIGVAVAIVVIFRAFLFTPVVVKGESMEPTFENNDKVVVSKISSINRFDMIVFKAPNKTEQHIKRVIGLPGDVVEMKDDVLYVNGEAYEEEYVNRSHDFEVSKITGDFTLEELTGEREVPADHFFVLGDNRLRSGDSRSYGFIPAKSVVGEVKFRFYPFKGFGVPK